MYEFRTDKGNRLLPGHGFVSYSIHMFISNLSFLMPVYSHLENEARNKGDFISSIHRRDRDRTGWILGFSSEDASCAFTNTQDLIFPHWKLPPLLTPPRSLLRLS